MIDWKAMQARPLALNLKLASATLAWIAYCGFSPEVAWAQQVNPSELVRNSFRPAPQRQVGVGNPLEGNLAAPANADKVFVAVRKVAIDGSFPELQEKTAELVSQAQGRRLSVAQVYEFARALQQAYAAADFPLAQVVLQPQALKSGVIQITVIDGFVEGVDVSGAPETERGLVMARLQPLIGKRHMSLEEIQRKLLLVGELHGMAGANNTNKRGAQPGGVILTITGAEKLVSSMTSVDNRLSKYLGTWEVTSSGSVDNAFGFGEQIYGGVGSSRDITQTFDGTAMYQAYGGGVSVPIGADGFTVSAGFLSVRTLPENMPGTFPPTVSAVERVPQRFERAYVRASYPLILTLQQSLRVVASYEATEERTRLGPAPFGFVLPTGFLYDVNRDRYGALRFSGEWGVLFPWEWGGKAVSTAVYSHGLGGRTNFDPFNGAFLLPTPPLSRFGASPDFNKLYLETRVTQPLVEEFQVALIAKAQTSFGQPLVLAEQFSLDGYDGVSGFALGTLNVDRGAVVRGELSRPFSFNLFESSQVSVSPYTFGAWGRGAREWPFIGEPKNLQAESFGGGLRAGTALLGAPLGESFTIECAKDYSNIFYYRSGYRTTVSFSVRY
jgi:hemolysin activation/secretion protein